VGGKYVVGASLGTYVGTEAVPSGLGTLMVPPIGTGRSPYLKTNDVFFCPEDFQRAPYRFEGNIGGVRFTGFSMNHPTVPYSTAPTAALARYMSYWYYYFPKTYTAGNPQKGGPLDEPMRDSDNIARKGAGSRMVMTDQGYTPIEFWPTSLTTYASTYPYFHGKKGDRTKEGCNALYLDGHVQFVTRGEIESVAEGPAFTDPSRAAVFDWYWVALMSAYDRAAGG
jgi:prepilin-type processing-associated H-X9-DG protein